MNSHLIPFSPTENTSNVLSLIPASAMGLPFPLTNSLSTDTACHSLFLPKLPVPPLKQTLEKYVRSVKPFLTELELSKTCEVVRKFEEDEGPILQELLIKRSVEMDNWLKEWWEERAYLSNKQPIVVHSSPGFCTSQRIFNSNEDMVDFSVHVVYEAARFYQDVIEERLQPDSIGNVHLDMSQYSRIFGTVRVSQLGKDILYRAPYTNTSHALILHKGNFIIMPIFTKDGQLASKANLKFQIQRAIEISAEPACEQIGLITTLPRDALYYTREEIMKNEINLENIKLIQSSLFVLCIDEPIASSEIKFLSALVDAKECAGARAVLHGGGSKYNSGNRWFDMCLQLIISKDGQFGLTHEHTPVDGIPIVRLLETILKSSEIITSIEVTLNPQLLEPIILKWELTVKSQMDIQNAAVSIDTLVSDTDVQIYNFKEFGKNIPKENRLSPDSFIQIALQLAYYKLHNKLPATYESGATRKFYLGRTDTIRSTCVESDEFICSMFSDEITESEKTNLLRKAVEAHRNYAIEVVNGQGIDRHMLGLNLVAKQHGMTIPEIFTDKAYIYSQKYTLSTSQAPSKHGMILCFGAVEFNGYGVSYNPHETKLQISVASFNSCIDTSTSRFIKALEESLLQMKQLLCNTNN